MSCMLVILVVIIIGYDVEATIGNQTEWLGRPSGLLSRRARAVVFPKGSTVLITAAMTKIIVGGRPSGLQYSVEFDMYVSLPDTVDGWRPNILLDHDKSTGAKPMHRWDWNWNDYRRNGTRYSNVHRKPHSFYRGPYQPEHYANYVKSETHKEYFYKRPWQLNEAPWQRHQRGNLENEVYKSWADVPRWKLNRDYRERREIFDQFETMGNYFRLDIRSCIERSMCELRARFNEQHGSGLLMEDLLRIILTLPEDVAEDKYQHRVNVRDCARFYAVSCPYRVLDFLTMNSNASRKTE
ncbi:uncharacterized protein LOC6574094 [Drosophila mojavensis]|uniref:Uncharacterized protein n=1 Tax=Drosophila mojavensis TaxID=7230 RepID=B4K9W5_DROMO|nr:uncharacterized protein LOC6574094 [Drosophila mojavensis]EDW15613.2 uncharacterized protein Dmoj_GI10074 [Drosophila mojavensis]